MNESACLLKVVLVGDESVGKSSLLERIIYNNFKSEISATIGLIFASKIVTLSENMNVRLQIWDIAGNDAYKLGRSNYYHEAAIVCIVLDTTNTRKDEQSKIAQVEKYKKQIDERNDHKVTILVIDNKNDCPKAVKMTEDELSQLESLGISRSHYIYASAKTNQANDQTLTECLMEFAQKYIDANSNVIRRKTNYESFKLPAASSPSSPLPLLSVAWWAGLFSSVQQRAEFFGASTVRQQINQLSDERAIEILQGMHQHLMKGTATADRKEPFELGLGGGSDTLSFIDKSTQQEVSVKYKCSFPHHCIPWLRICVPYVHYKTHLPASYVSSAKNELLQLFNNIVFVIHNLKPYCRRNASTQGFYNELPNFLISQIYQRTLNTDASITSLSAAAASLR